MPLNPADFELIDRPPENTHPDDFELISPSKEPETKNLWLRGLEAGLMPPGAAEGEARVEGGLGYAEPFPPALPPAGPQPTQTGNVTLSSPIGVPMQVSKDVMNKVGAGMYDVAAGGVNFALSPAMLNLSMAPAIPLGAETAAATFAGLMAKQGGEQLGEASVTGDIQTGTEGALNLAGAGAVGLGALAHKRGVDYASQVRTPAEVYGDVQPLKEPTQELPAQEGGPGVQPQAEPGVSPPKGEVPLAPPPAQPDFQYRELSKNVYASDTPPPPGIGAYNVIHVKSADGEYYRFRIKKTPATPAATPEAPTEPGLPMEVPQATPPKPQAEDYLEQQRKKRAEAKAAAPPPTPHPSDPIVEESAKNSGQQIQWTDQDLGGEQPFAGRVIAQAQGGNQILINRQEMLKWLERDVPRERWERSIRALIGQESVHNEVINGLGGPEEANIEAAKYWNNLTAFERAVEAQRYGGEGGIEGLEPHHLGHEAIRFRLERAAGMEPLEFATTVGAEHWSLRGLTVLEEMVRGARERLGTKASKVQLEIMDRIEHNVTIAMAVQAGIGPAALRRRDHIQTREELLENIRLAALMDKRVKDTPPINKQEQAESRQKLTDAWIEYLDRFYGNTIELDPEGRPVDTSKRPPEKGDYPFARRRKAEEEEARYRAAMAGKTVPIQKSGKKPEEESQYQEGMFLPPIHESQKEPVVSASEMGAAPAKPLTELAKKADEVVGGDIKEIAVQRKEGSLADPTKDLDKFRYEAPQFSEFERWAKDNMGRVTDAQIRDAWVESVWGHLMKADPERLMRWAKALDVAPDWLKAEDIPKAQEEPAFQLEQEVEGKSSKAARLAIQRQEHKKVTLDQQKRNRLITDVAEALIDQAAPAVDLDRKGFDLEDIDFSNPVTTTGAYAEIDPRDASSPERLTKLLRDGARTKNRPEAHTKRLVALRDNQDGSVSLVSTYNDAGTQMIVDPAQVGVTKRPNKPLDQSILRRYTPIATALLKDPIRNFHKRFDTELDYLVNVDTPGKDAESARDIHGAEPRSELEESDVARPVIEGEPPPEGMRPEDFEELPKVGVERGEGGGVTGENAGEARALLGMGRGELLSREPITDNEAMAVMDLVTDEAKVGGAIDTASGMGRAIDALVKRAEERKLTGKDYAAIGGLRKAAETIYRKSVADSMRQLRRRLSEPERIELATKAYAETLEKYHDLIFNTPDKASYLKAALGEFTRKTAEDYALGERGEPGKIATPGAAGIQRELEAPQRGPIPLTRGVKRPTTQAPTEPAKLGLPSEAEVRARAAQQFPYEPTELPGEQPREKLGMQRLLPGASAGEPAKVDWRAKAKRASDVRKEQAVYQKEAAQRAKQAKARAKAEPFRLMPNAMRRVKDEVQAEFAHKLQQAKVVYTRRDVTKDIWRLNEGANHAGMDLANQWSQIVKLASLDKAPTGLKREGLNKDTIARWVDNAARNKKAVQRREAVGTIIAATDTMKTEAGDVQYTNPAMLDNFGMLLDQGEAKAKMFRESPDPRKRVAGFRWERALKKQREILEFAKKNINDPRLIDATESFRDVTHEVAETLNENGMPITERKNYYPGRYEGEIWNDNAITFGEQRIMGLAPWEAKRFDNVYEALAHGPYIPVSYDAADLLQSSASRSLKRVAEKQWMDWLKTVDDPARKALYSDPMSGKKINSVDVKIAREPIGTVEKIPALIQESPPEQAPGQLSPRLRMHMAKLGRDVGPPKMKMQENIKWAPPNGEYELVYPDGNEKAKPIAVRKGYAKAVRGAMATYDINRNPYVRAAAQLSSILKHGIVLMLDTYHGGRLSMTARFGGGKNWHDLSAGFRGGYSALTYRLEDLPKAVEKGVILQKSADWAMEKVPVREMTRTGINTTMKTRWEIAHDFVKQGLNATKITDALYRNAVQNIPVIGKYWNAMLEPVNKLTFDRLTPGLMVEMAVRNFERLNKAHPEIPYDRLLKDIQLDVNAEFGNMGKQGIFKSAKWRELANIFILAPQWREGLFQKDMRYLGRLTGISNLTGGRKGVPQFGVIGRTMTRGIAGFFVLNQILNLISRQKFTWQNEEEGHQMDAWIPYGDSGFWMPTLSVFGEIIGDFQRLAYTKPTVKDAVLQMGANAMGPVGRAVSVLASSKSPTGEYTTTTRNWLTTAAGQLAPSPISVTGPARAVLSPLTGGQIAPNRPGDLPRRILSSVGLRTVGADTATQQIYRKAQRFVKAQGKTTPMMPQTTDEPGYNKLRSAIRQGDMVGADKMLGELLKTHEEWQVEKAMREFSRRPFTGSRKMERLFEDSLSDHELELYNQADMQRAQEYNAFLDLWMKHGNR